MSIDSGFSWTSTSELRTPFSAGTKRMGRVRVAPPSYPIPLSMVSRVHQGSQMMSELVSFVTSLVTPGPLSPLTHPSAPTSLSLILPSASPPKLVRFSGHPRSLSKRITNRLCWLDGYSYLHASWFNAKNPKTSRNSIGYVFALYRLFPCRFWSLLYPLN